MQAVLTAAASILAIAGSMAAARRWLGVPVCPICLGVGGTWLWMLAARQLGAGVDTTVLAVLLGGSVAGLAAQVERHLPAARSALAWKIFFMPPGFVLAYALVGQRWLLAGALALGLAALAAWFLAAPRAAGTDSEQVEALTRKMKNCC